MDLLAALIDFILHVDVHLAQFVADHGRWVYALLFAIIFVETGLVVMPFLPGDSLLFVVGALCRRGADGLAHFDGAAGGRGDPRRPGELRHRAVLRAACVRLAAVTLFQQARLRPGACLLRALWRHHDHRGALHAVHPHLRALRRGRRRNDALALHRLQHGRSAAVGGLAGVRGPAVRQHPVGQGPPRQDHLGHHHHSGPDRHLRRLEGSRTGRAGVSTPAA